MSKSLRYSGVIQPVAIQDSIDEKIVQIESYDFLKRMEQFPAAWVSDANGDFYQIPGIELLGYNQGEAAPETKVCNFKFKYPAESKLPNTEIQEVYFGTKNGIKTLRYRSWGWFQWDNGPWTEKTLGEESDIEANDGSKIKCRFAGFTQEDGLDVVKIENQAVSQRGGIEISFDEGTIARLSSPFSFIIREEAGPPIVVNDITTACLVEGDTASAIASIDDTLYIGALDRFQIIELEFDKVLTGATLTFEYSRSSWEDWSDLSSYIISDGTSNFSQSGIITFTPPTNWVRAGQKVGEDAGDDIVVDRYWIRIGVSVWGSGEAVIRSIFRNYIVVGQDGDSIEIKVNFDEISELDKTESVIIRPSDSDSSVFVPATWKKNLPIDHLLGSGSESDISSSLLAASGFSESCRDVDAIDYTFTKNKMSIWGIPPFPAYLKKPHCVCGGRVIDGAQELFLGIGDEVWKVTEHSGFEFLFKVKAWYSVDMDRPFVVEVRQLNYDSTNEALFGVAWMAYDDNVYRPIVDDEDTGYLGRCTPAIAFRHDFSHIAPEVEDFQHIIGVPPGGGDGETTADKPRFLSGEVFHRNGNDYLTGSQYKWGIGTTVKEGAEPNLPLGEMIPVPEVTFLSIRRKDNSGDAWTYWPWARTSRVLLETVKAGSDLTEHYQVQHQWFLNNISSEGSTGPFLETKAGFFYYARQGWLSGIPYGPVSLRFSFGQKGFLIWRPGSRGYVYHDYFYGDILATRNYIGEIRYDSAPAWTISRQLNLSDFNKQPCCGTLIDDATILYGYMKWIEACDGAGAPTKSESGIADLNVETMAAGLYFYSSSSTILGSLAGRETFITPIDLGYDPIQEVIHVCFFDRETMQYHYAVIEKKASPDAYSIQEGTKFNYDWYRPFKHFVYSDGVMYAICTDDRFQKDDAFLVKVTFSKPDITIEKVAILNTGDYSCSEIVVVDGTIYGIAQPSGTLWSYGTKWVPRVQLADFGDKNCRAAATDLCQAANAILRVGPDRQAIIEKRETVPASSSTLEDELVKVKPEKAWKFIYDGCSVGWSFLEKSGTESWGLTGRNQRILKISNPFIQDLHFASKVAEIYGSFFFKKRTVLPVLAKYLPELERSDSLKIVSKGIDPSAEREIVSIRLRNSTGQTEMELVKR